MNCNTTHYRANSSSVPGDPTPGEDFEDRLIKAIGLRTRMLVVSWVRFQDGLKLDLGRLGRACRERDVHLVVDGIQGAGTSLPDLENVSAFATGGHKGLLAPQGQGFLWTRPEFRALLIPSGTWLSVEDGWDFSRPTTDHDRSWVQDGRRLESGVPNLMACSGLCASLELIAQADVARIAMHVRQSQDALLSGLRAVTEWKEEAYRLRALLEADRLGPILSFHRGDREPQTMQTLLDRGVIRGIYASVREGYLRIAFHGWHQDEDVARLAEWMGEPVT